MTTTPRHQRCIGDLACTNPPVWLVYSSLSGIVKDRATCDEHKHAFWRTLSIRPIDAQATGTQEATIVRRCNVCQFERDRSYFTTRPLPNGKRIALCRQCAQTWDSQRAVEREQATGAQDATERPS